MIIAIEGGVGAGKTTLLKGLAQALPDCVIIPEYFDIIPEDEHLPLLAMSEEAKLKKFLEVEKERYSIVEKGNSGTYILDRSFLTLLSYQHGIRRFKQLPSYLLSPEHMKNNFVLPDIVIHLDVDDGKRRKRVEERENEVLPILLDADFCQRVRDFFDAHVHATHYKKIDTTKISKKEVFERAMEFINSYSPQMNQKEIEFSNVAQSIKDKPSHLPKSKTRPPNPPTI